MPAPSSRPGLGAMPYAGGVTFRVWAPFAPWVRVAGTFNGWSGTATDLASEGNGYWSLDLPGAAVGDQYRYVLGDLTRWRVDPRARAVTQSDGNGVVTRPDYPWRVNDFRTPPWNELVVYELHAGSYPDRRAAPAEMLRAVARELGHLRDLGVNAIEIMPAKEFPGDDSWGYNPVHVFAVESHYGGPDALRELVDTAHGLGIAVFMDVVYNHIGPADLNHSVWQFDGWFQRVGDKDMGGVYFYNDWRSFTDWGREHRPDYGRPEVREFLRDAALMWFDEYRLDGLRFDMTCWMRNVYGRDGVPPGDPTDLDGWGWNLLRWITDEVNWRHPGKLTIAEDMRQNPAITRPTGQGGAGFGSQWDDQFHHVLRRALIAPRDEDRDMREVKASIERAYDRDAFRRVVYTECHDEVGEPGGKVGGKQRLPEEIQPGRADGWYAQKRSTLGAAVVFTSPGIPMIFQGQEMLEWGQFTGSAPMDWDKIDRFPGIVTLYRDLIRLRRNWFDNTRGLRGHHTNVFHAHPTEPILAVHRWQDGGPGDDVVILLNFSARAYPNYTVGFPRAGTWYVRLNSDWAGYSPIFGDHPSHHTTAEWGDRDRMPCHGNVGLGPYTAVILSQ